MAAWMLYSMAVAGLLSVAATTVERGVLGAKLPTRWVWVVALVAGVGTSAVGGLVPSRPGGGLSVPSSQSGHGPIISRAQSATILPLVHARPRA